MAINYQACWQLPVTSKPTEAEWVSPKSKYHYFTNDVSMCGKYYQATKDFGNIIENKNEEQKEKSNDRLCKKCIAAMTKQNVVAHF